MLDDVRTDLQLRIEETGAEITADELPTVEGDEGQLRQVLRNLVENAIEYSSDDFPAIEITAEREGDRWRIDVTDDGVGIDPDDQDRVFEVFQRLHARSEHDGTGIGLALCKRSLERHGGDIWVESAAGEGAAFSFTLPAVE
nr:ATP-binding protein [Halolamina sp. CBA1230]